MTFTKYFKAVFLQKTYVISSNICSQVLHWIFYYSYNVCITSSKSNPCVITWFRVMKREKHPVLLLAKLQVLASCKWLLIWYPPISTFSLSSYSIFASSIAKWLTISNAWKVCKYGVFSGLYFPVFGLNTEIYGVNFRIQSGYRKIRTRKNSVFRHFWCSV